jgi:hypothetical protein
MALHRRKKFAELCGVSQPYLNNYIKRGKVILSGDYVDDEIPQNIDFYKSRKPKNESGSLLEGNIIEKLIKQAEQELSLIEPKKEGGNQHTKKIPEVKQPENKESGGLYNIDVKLKLQQLSKLEVDTRIQELKEKKLIGDVIPTDLVKVVFVQHSQSILTEFKNSVDDIITILAKSKGMNVNEIAEIRGSLVKVVNVAVDKAIGATKNNLQNIIDEFSIKKEVGEREP